MFCFIHIANLDVVHSKLGERFFPPPPPFVHLHHQPNSVALTPLPPFPGFATRLAGAMIRHCPTYHFSRVNVETADVIAAPFDRPSLHRSVDIPYQDHFVALWSRKPALRGVGFPILGRPPRHP